MKPYIPIFILISFLPIWLLGFGVYLILFEKNNFGILLFVCGSLIACGIGRITLSLIEFAKAMKG